MSVKTFRDPIHGDIAVGPMQLAVIDSDAFQRLRYVKQNGLLHLVFPGAVHTRFAHSIGAMHVAQRAFTRLFPAYRIATRGNAGGPDPIRYIGTVFEFAALLHDIGHCAFSHSIEKVDEPGSGFRVFPEVEQLVPRWANDFCPELVHWWARHRGLAIQAAKNQGSNWIEYPKHEEIGLFLGYMALKCPSIVDTKHEKSRAEIIFPGIFPQLADSSPKGFDNFVDDVLSLMRDELDWLKPSPTLVGALLQACSKITRPPANPTEEHAMQLFRVLHSLVSGTLDVDRMDYLLRDSHFAGTVIGKYDLDLIINSLSLGCAGEEGIVLCVADRARGAIDDFLWSRWQLYLQVINHKANVVLESIFPDAFKAVTKQPADLDDYAEILLFTDETVMSQVRRDFLATHKRTNPAKTPAKLAFLRTRLPKHLHVEELDEVEDIEAEKTLIARKQSELAHAMGVSLSEIRVTKTSSDLIKSDGALPRVVRKVVVSSGLVDYQLCDPDYLSRRWQEAGRPTRVRRVHFFTTADLSAHEIMANPAPVVEALMSQITAGKNGAASVIRANRKK